MEHDQIISQKFLQQYVKIAGIALHKNIVNKRVPLKGYIKKLDHHLYCLKSPLFDKEGLGILDVQSFWKVLQKTELIKYFSWNEESYKIVCAKLN